MKKTGIIILILAVAMGGFLYLNREGGQELPLDQNTGAAGSMISPLGMAQAIIAQASIGTEGQVEASEISEEDLISDILTSEETYEEARGLFQEQLGYDQETMEDFWTAMTAQGNQSTVADWVEVLNTWYLEPATEEYIESLNGSGAAPIDLPVGGDEGMVMDEPALTGTWVWQETIMNNDEITTPTNPGDFTLTFTNESVSGTTDCNNFSGSYKADSEEATISFGPLMSTKMACEGSQEMAFTADLAEVSGYIVTEEGNLALLLKYDSGSIIFTPAATEE